MSDTRSFCPRCGDPTDAPAQRERRPEDPGLCDACYFEQFDLVDAPERVQVNVCATCGAVHKGNRWVDVGARDYTDVAVEAVSESLAVNVDAEGLQWAVDPEQVDENTIRMHCYLTGVVRETPLEEEVTVPVSISRGTCDRCGRIAGDYYAATVQVRGRNRTPTDAEVERAKDVAQEYIADREEAGDREAFVSRVTESNDGVDIRVSTTQIGQAISDRIVRQFGGTISDSETLVTEDEDGNEVYRVTYAVRLPEFTPGDVIDTKADDEGPVLVRSVKGNLKGVRLTTGEPYEATFEEGDAPDARKLGTVDDGQETTLVTVEDDHAVQVLDPETYRSVTIARPNYLDPDADTVTVLKSRAGLHVLPDEDG